MKFPMLYKKNSDVSIQFWEIWTQGATICTRWGQEGTEHPQYSEDVIKTGKNVGKKNETSPVQQAEAEAKSQHEKKIKKGYVLDILKAARGEVDTGVIEGGYFPMLAHTYSKRGHDIQFPAYVQPKFDGHRCVTTEGPGALLWSRTRKPITSMVHIQKAIEGLNRDPERLDGELYNHDYRKNFEELTHFIRSPGPTPGSEIMQYHIYDVNLPGKTFAERDQWLRDNIPANHPVLKLVETILVNNEDEMMLAFEKFVAQGFEGLMIRNAAGLYEENKRSANLQKVKEFDDSEFPITGVEEGRGKLNGCAIFVCKTQDGTEFRVKMTGDQENLKVHFQNPPIGKMLTVKYQGLTGKSKVPRFPVGLRLRQDI